MSSQLPPPPNPNQQPTTRRAGRQKVVTYPIPTPNQGSASPAWWPIDRWDRKRKLVGWGGLVLTLLGLFALLPTQESERAGAPSPSSPERYRDYAWRDEVCDGSGWDYSGIFVNIASPRKTRSFELVATLYDGQTLVDRDTELVLDLAPGASEAVEFVFGAPGTRCVLEMVTFR
jgi:hypothetical protein